VIKVENNKKQSFDPTSLSCEELEKIAFAFNQMEVMTGIVDTEGNIVFANQSALHNVGANFQQVKGMPFRDSPWRSHSEEAKKITDEMLAKALKGERVSVEDTIVDRNGKKIPVIFSISPLFDSEGKVVALIPEGKIISELKCLQKKLEKERWQTRQWLDSLDTNVVMCDTEGKIKNCNRAFLRTLQKELEDVVGKKIYELPWFRLSKKDQKRIKSCISQACKGVKSTIEANVSIHNGDKQRFIINLSPIFSPEGEIKFLSIEAKDISEQVKLRELMLQTEKDYSTRLRKEVEDATRALRETEQFNKNLVDSAPLGIMHLTDDGKVVFVNPELEKKLTEAGIDKSQIKGKRLSELNLYPANASWEKIRMLYYKGHEFRHERLILRRQGKEPLLFEISTAPLKGPGGKGRGNIVIMNDVTEKTRLEQELFKTRMQSEKLASLGQLIAGVAHEINNPLTSIIGCAEFLIENCNLKGTALEAAGVIAAEAKRSGEIVKNLLAFARQSSPKKKPSDINELIRSVVGIRMYGLKDIGVNIKLKLTDNLPPVEVDSNQIQQVILNLINNAIDAISESGIGDTVLVRSFQDGKDVKISVEDNGPGIPKEIHEKIFDPFFTTKELGKGTGLGLSISYGIIKQHRGDIIYNPVLPHGTQFVVSLPYSQSSIEETLPQEQMPDLSPYTILVVDDEKSICISVSNYLKELVRRVDMAFTATEALEKLRRHQYDILLVDLKMPEMDGLEFYKILVQDYSQLVKGFVLMTGFQSEAVKNFKKETGSPVLSKPFERKELVDALARVIKSNENNRNIFKGFVQ